MPRPSIAAGEKFGTDDEEERGQDMDVFYSGGGVSRNRSAVGFLADRQPHKCNRPGAENGSPV
jgi:hypothetical protein